MSLLSFLSFLFPSLRKPVPFFAPPSRPPAYERGARVWVASARCYATVCDVQPVAGRWHYSVDLDSHEDCRCVYRESDLSSHETHPYWNLPHG